MVSEKYEEDFRNEYRQIKAKIKELDRTIEDCYMGMLAFKQSEYISLLEKQLSAMKDYMLFLEIRARYEGVKLSK